MPWPIDLYQGPLALSMSMPASFQNWSSAGVQRMPRDEGASLLFSTVVGTAVLGIHNVHPVVLQPMRTNPSIFIRPHPDGQLAHGLAARISSSLVGMQTVRMAGGPYCRPLAGACDAAHGDADSSLQTV